MQADEPRRERTLTLPVAAVAAAAALGGCPPTALAPTVLETLYALHLPMLEVRKIGDPE